MPSLDSRRPAGARFTATGFRDRLLTAPAAPPAAAARAPVRACRRTTLAEATRPSESRPGVPAAAFTPRRGQQATGPGAFNLKTSDFKLKAVGSESACQSQAPSRTGTGR